MEKKSKIRIFHTADVHLDSPFSRLDVKQSEKRRNELRGVFTSMMIAAKANRADIVLIAGDLFDNGYAGEQTVALLKDTFLKAPECKFVISAGNHDPNSARSIYRMGKFPDNVYVFDSQELSKFTFDDIGVDVWGWSFVSEKLTENPLKNAVTPTSDNIPLLCAHCDLGASDSPYAPVSLSDIERFGAAYSALGHIHKRGEVHHLKDGRLCAYSGCPEGRSFDETGDGGAYIVDIERGDEGRHKVNVTFQKFSVSSYMTESLDLTGVLFPHQAEEKIRTLIENGKFDEKTSLRLKLTGIVGVGCGALDNFSANDLGLFSLEIRDMTSPTFDTGELERDMTIRGAVYRHLAPMLNSEDENERKMASDALRVSFAALSGSDFVR